MKKILRFQKQQVVRDPLNTQVFNFARFKQQLSIDVISCCPQTLQVQIQGIDASIANAIRRIATAEIPTMAFHKVLLYQNTSVLPDQLLVHRLGLLPLAIDADAFDFRKEEEDTTETNSLKFVLKVTCRRKKLYEKLSQEEIIEKDLKPEEYLENCNIYSNQLKWFPQGKQASNSNTDTVKLVHSNILIAKLRENQQIYLQIFAEKGIGKKHAKWSPVSTAFYRLMPQITINPTFNHSKHGEALISCCPADVFSKQKGKVAVTNGRGCTTCRECLNLEGVDVGKVEDHYIFVIQSIGTMPATQIFVKALEILEDKSKNYLI